MKRLVILGISLVVSLGGFSQNEKKLSNKEGGGYEFTEIVNNEATEVQNQNRTGTCWSFSALSFFESELMRLGKGEHILSEMYIVRMAYKDKADLYVRREGKANFSQGGAFVDIPHVIRKYGIVPEEVYKGLNYGSDEHDHSELEGIMKAMLDKVVGQRTRTDKWDEAIDGILDAYLGEVPVKFTYKGKEYTPKSYAASLGLNMDDYISVTSFTHHPFYSKFIIAVQDNWTHAQSYNVPLEELEGVMDNALKNKYTIAWGADVSEKGFSFKNALAIVPENLDDLKVKGKDNKHFNDAGADKQSSAFDEPKPEKNITQEMRQLAYDQHKTTDDHGMHATGIVKDQKGNEYYIIKNSWGTEHNDCDGYFYCSKPYFRYKTINIMVHKDALPKALKKKLNVK